jgi:putative tricarboxylic transport membrane protein
MSWVDPRLLFLTAAGTFAGIYIGAIPGLSVTMAVSILISFTFKWDVNSALALIAGIFPRRRLRRLAQRHPAQHPRRAGGHRHRARRLSRSPSAARPAGHRPDHRDVGGRRLHRHPALAWPRRPSPSLALKFAPRDYLLLAIWGILLVGSLSGGSLAKGIFAGALGVLIGMVGLDPMTAEPRFTFGSSPADRGISYVAAMIGFFGVAEVLVQLHDLKLKPSSRTSQDHPVLEPGAQVPAAVAAHLAIGVVVGALPAPAATSPR